MTVSLSTSLQYLKGVGPARLKTLQDAGLETVEDLFYYFPRRHLDRTTVTPIRSLERDSYAFVVGTVQVCGEKKTRKRKLFQVILSDGTGLLTLTWFNGISYIKKSLSTGDRLAVYGKVEFFNGMQIVHPEYDKINTDDDPLNTGSVIPLYPLTQTFKKVGLDQLRFRRMTREILKQVSSIPDILSEEVKTKYNLIPLSDALSSIHFAENVQDLHRAVHRLKFDEHFFLQLLMALRKESVKQTGAVPLKESGPYIKRIYESLPFELTDAQKRVIKEIRQDLAKPNPMNRLLQGDVGSGKTVVALLMSALAIGNQTQVAIMVPTEILAHQHYESIKSYAESARITCAILVGNTPAKERNSILDALADENIQLIIGTHALIQQDVKFKDLGLVIVDEQHRFGVMQRGELVEKGFNPHFLAMTATPIPRTLAITYHGDMDLSIIDELPKNRQPITTKKVDPERLKKVYAFIRDEVHDGRQCMIVYPLVEETEKSDLAAATEAFDDLKENVFEGISVGLIHGRMKKEEKDAVMDSFAKNEINILVATTVIEVGIDIPNASVMLIEHADRFGLTQLHQLRGRVGRGTAKSYCILVQRNFTKNSKRRLKIMEETNDGFLISDEDLKIRGPGEFFGIRQSGFLTYKIADLITDGPLIRQARQYAFSLIEEDPHLRKQENQGIRTKFMKDYQQMLEIVNIS